MAQRRQTKPHRLALWLSVLMMGCGTGQQIAAGPVVGWVSGRGWSAGWEAGGGPMTTFKGGDPTPSTPSLLARANVGMSWRPPLAGGDTHERVTYVVWEPWLFLGGTLGIRTSSSDGVHPVFGLWEGVPYVFGAFKREAPLYRCSPCATLSVAFGWRFDGSGEFYLAPKVGILNGTDMPYPFQSYAD
jgi:hypothetical protein